MSVTATRLLGVTLLMSLLLPFTDKRDGKQYATMEVNGQRWLKPNLSYAIPGKIDQVINDQGAYYSREEAKVACPAGYRLMTLKDFNHLLIGMDGEENKLQGKVVTKTVLEQYGFLLGGLSRGNGLAYEGQIGFYWTASDTLKPHHKTPDAGDIKHYIAIHIYQAEDSSKFNIEPTYVPETASAKRVNVNCKCVQNTD